MSLPYWFYGRQYALPLLPVTTTVAEVIRIVASLLDSDPATISLGAIGNHYDKDYLTTRFDHTALVSPPLGVISKMWGSLVVHCH